MGPLDFAIHLMGFAAPAFFLAMLLPVASRLVLRRPAAVGWAVQSGLVFAAGLAVLGAGLWYFGRDGKMLTYAALVLAAATVQWFAARGWR